MGVNAKRILVLVFAALSVIAALASDSLENGFANPPAETKPWCYWYWISDNVSKEGITKDLEAMARVGIGEALIGNIFLDEVPAGKIKVLSPEWWALVEHAIHEARRTGVNIGMFNCPGWSQSGGPWIQPTQAMRYLVSSETRVTGPAQFRQKLPAPKEQFQDVAVLAFPEPEADADGLGSKAPRVSCSPEAAGVEKLVDGDLSTAMEFPPGAGRGRNAFSIEFETAEAFAARSLCIVATAEPFGAECELQAGTDAGEFRAVRRFKCDRSNMSPGVGFMPRGPVVISFPAVAARKFRLVFTGVFAGGNHAALAEVNLSGAARLESFVEKQLGKMHPTPLPMWDTYLWRTQSEPDSAALVVPQKGVRDLSGSLSPDGTLAWDVPPGRWVILRTGMTPTGMRNGPASPEGQGLEVDKMNRPLARHHFDAFIGQLLKRVPATDRPAFTRVIADSYEMGSQNWTDGFDADFQQRYGYNPKPWLPVLTGRLIGSADQSERFLWDLRRLVADRVATEYVGGLRQAANAHRLGLWLENYGHWGFPSEFLKYGSESDRISGEYWVSGDLGSIELRAASSCANTYGKKFVSAESFTGGPPFQNAPGALKARGDWAFCEGVNHFVLHVNIHQPWDDKVPGVNAPFGTEFNRHNTWFERSQSWIQYLRRCCWLLQQGTRVADVAYYIGDDAPKMTGVRNPALPEGRDFDYINGEVIERLLAVKNGRLTLPHGTTYEALVLPQLDTMRPEVLRKISDLVKAGATVVGTPPARSPSMQNYPRCDAEVKELAAALWGSADTATPGERTFGKGRVVWGKSLEQILGSQPDFESPARLRFTHRRAGGTDIFFVANSKAEPLAAAAAFRVGAKAPEIWWPDSGRIEKPAVYDVADGRVRLPLSFGPHGSMFVVFRAKAAPAAERIVSVKRDGKELLGTRLSIGPGQTSADKPGNFTFAVWVNPADDTALPTESNRGIVGLAEKRNDALTAPHGNSFGGNDHAGAGLAIGTNGICVFEHGANYFTPTLVCTGSVGGWTHLAVVYRDNQPSLFLNGELVRTGLNSEHIVHSGAGGGAAGQFRGQLGAFQQFEKSLSPAEVLQLAGTMPVPDTVVAGPPVQLRRASGRKFEAAANAPGDYELIFGDGKQRSLKIKEKSPAVQLGGPWQVSFIPGSGAPLETTFDQLLDLTCHLNPEIKYFSGKVTYRRSFELPADWGLSTRSRSKNGAINVLLELGQVRDLATVRVNGKQFGTLWLAPWQLDITGAVRPGENTLEVEVVDVWNNRLVGDLQLPQEQRRTVLLAPTVGKNSPLLPAGLLGPVQVRAVPRVTMER